MQIVGNCPQCGAPIWARNDGDAWFTAFEDDQPQGQPPPITYSCECRLAETPVPKCETRDPYDIPPHIARTIAWADGRLKEHDRALQQANEIDG